MLVMHHFADDQIHSDLVRIPLDRDWAAYHQELKGESAGGKREQLTAPIIYEKPALISFNMYIERDILPDPPSKEMRPANRQERDARRRAGPGRLLPGFHQGLVWHRQATQRLARSPCWSSRGRNGSSKCTYTLMHARWRLPQCCYSAIPRAKPHIIEHFISKVLAKAQRKVSIPVLECCYAIHHHGAAPQVPSIQHLRDALQDLCGTSGEPDVRDRKRSWTEENKGWPC